MRSTHATHNLIAVSANTRETAINTEQTLDTSLLCDLADVANLDPRRESNAGQPTGKEEPDTIYDLGKTANMSLTFPRAQAQHFGLLLGYGLGSVSSAARGDGYRHTITPISGDLDSARSNPSFTAGQRFGLTVLKRRFASMFVNSVEATFSSDNWVQLKGACLGTGKVTNNVVEEDITAAPNATSLVLAANAVEGANAQARLDNVHRIRVELTSGVWTDVSFTAVSSAAPAAITIAAPGGAGANVTYKVLYVPAESGWMSFPARVVETPLRVSQMTLVIGGSWNGSTFSGGRTLTSEINQLTYKLDNALSLKFVPGGSGDLYAGRCVRGGRTQVITLDREFRDYIYQQHIDDNDTFGVRVLCEGDLYDSTYKYTVELIFPQVGVLKAPVSVKDKLLAEVGDLTVLEHDTYGSVIAHVDNLVATYAA